MKDDRRGRPRPLLSVLAAAFTASSVIGGSLAFFPPPPSHLRAAGGRTALREGAVACDGAANGAAEDAAEDAPPRRYFATCVPGLQDALAREIGELPGTADVEPSGSAGVGFSGPADGSAGLRALLWLRTAHRVMELVGTTEGTGEALYDRDDLYAFVRETVDVKNLLGDGRGGLLALSVRAVPNGRPPKDLCHTHYTALTVKNALVDAVRDLRDDGTRPSVDLEDPDVPLVAVLRGWGGTSAQCSLYRCLHSGGSLHRRGYRIGGDGQGGRGESSGGGGGGGAIVHKAALKETLAAGLLLEAGWDRLVAAAREDGRGAVLVDPMAGSGTLALEAALIAADVAPGLMRIRAHRKGEDGWNPHQIPPAVRWRAGDMDGWKALLTEAAQRARDGAAWAGGAIGEGGGTGGANCEIYANELDPRAAGLARSCIGRAWVAGDLIRLTEGNCEDWDLGGESEGADAASRAVVEGRTIVVSNPPWGKRLTEDIDESWEGLRTFLRRECDGAEAWVLSGNKALTKILRMKKSRSVVVKTADEDLRWLQYHIFRKKGKGSGKEDELKRRAEEGRVFGQPPPSGGAESWY